MLTMYTEVNSALNEDPMPFDGNEWSIFKSTSAILSDSISMYDEFNNHPVGSYTTSYEVPLKPIKSEPMTDFQVSPDAQCYGEWKKKYIDHWSSQDCLYWVIYELHDLNVGQGLPELKIEEFSHIDGMTLKKYTLTDFMNIFPNHGVELFHRLQRVKANPAMSNLYFDGWSNEYSSHQQELKHLTNLDRSENISPLLTSSLTYQEAESGYKSYSSEEECMAEAPPPPEKRRPGRPRGTRKKKKPEKLGRLWEFIRDLLLNPEYNPSLICWENYDEGTFRFVHSDRVAKLWGDKKENDEMNYEKLSRAMRYYYKSQVLLPVYGKRLVYKFGPTATGWRSERPIFRQG